MYEVIEMTVDYVMIGKHIKKKRKEIGFTQERLAEKINVTVGYISQLERGITKVNLDTLAKIGTVLNTELPYFFIRNRYKPKFIPPV